MSDDLTDRVNRILKPNLLSPAQIEQAAIDMHQIAEGCDCDAVLAGGAAMHYYGSPRLTADVDFVASDRVDLPERGTLTFGGEKLESPGGVPVDWIRRQDDYEGLYRAAVEDPLPEDESPAPVPIARPEYLLAMKLVADRAKDRADVEWLVANEVVDLKLARRIVKRELGAYAAEDFDAVVSEIQWKRSRGEL
jgi:hypothetical protein